MSRLPPFNVVMRDNGPLARDGSTCVAFERTNYGPNATKSKSVRWFEMASEYAASIGGECIHYSARRPMDSEILCMVGVYQSTNKEGKGRINGTFHRFVIIRHPERT